MRRNLVAAAMALGLAGIGAAGPGCANLDRPVAVGSKADEQALGFALAAGATANNAYALAIESGVLKDKAKSEEIYRLLGQYDQLLQAARQAKAVGDSGAFTAKLAAARVLYGQIAGLIPSAK